jgi:hypothetical protein
MIGELLTTTNLVALSLTKNERHALVDAYWMAEAHGKGFVDALCGLAHTKAEKALEAKGLGRCVTNPDGFTGFLATRDGRAIARAFEDSVRDEMAMAAGM